MRTDTTPKRLPLQEGVKRLIDVAAAVSLLVLLWPLLLLVALGILLLMGRPIFFRQARSGQGSRVFVPLKFRTMSVGTEREGSSLPDEARTTPFGTFLRRTSLDELPQIWNVLRGEMSLVGPRPLPHEYIARLDERQSLRLRMKPGLTGWTQVHWYPGPRSWEEKFELDRWYVENWSLGLDLWIMIRTPVALLRRAWRNRSGASTSAPFRPGRTSSSATTTPRSR